MFSCYLQPLPYLKTNKTLFDATKFCRMHLELMSSAYHILKIAKIKSFDAIDFCRVLSITVLYVF
ncbi:hypothetical protein Leryth_020563 [Lithospermum erythrorhizon]|nr:hypothetical protein Leryth_020563 [Lithospermum erythrorhizon]